MIKYLVWEAKCPFCKEKSYVLLDPREYERYADGELAQNAFRSLDDTQREIFISGICEDCQHHTFKEDDSDEGDFYDLFDLFEDD